MNIVATSIFLFLAMETHGSTQEPTYLVYFPRYLRAGFPIQIATEILKNPNPVHFSASLTTPAREIDFRIEDTLVEGESKLLVFNEQIPIDYDGTTDFELSILGRDTVRNETIFSNTTDRLSYERKSLSVFIQTDKGIYKPSQTIKFRAVVTNSDLLPHNGTVSYKITDPDRNIVLQKKIAHLVNGVAGSEFTLGRYSTHGTWRISFECEGNEQLATVTVDEYQLPKFEIEFSPDKRFVYLESEGYSGTISAKFTFGQPVKGVASLKLETMLHKSGFFWGIRTETKSVTRQFNDFNGQATFDIPIDELKREFEWDPEGDYERYVTVTITVRDKNSQTQIEETRNLNLVKVPFKVEIINAPQSIKPGLYYTAYLRITQYDGSRISEVQRQSLDMKIQYQYEYFRSEYQTDTGYLDMDVDKDGYVAFTMRTNSSQFDILRFSIESEKYYNRYIGGWNSRPYDSPSRTYIQLSTAKTILKPDETATFEVRSSWNNVSYSVMMLSLGTIVKQESYTPESYETDDDLFKFRYEFMVTKEMAPTVAITMYFIANNGEIVADNVVIKVEASMANMVALSTNVSEAKTGSPVLLSVQTTPGSTVALRAIDRSVILQEDGNDITTEGVFRELDRYSPITTFTCVYCYYYHSVGTNARQVLGQTGVFIFTDAATFLSQDDNYYSYRYPDIEENIMFDDAAIAVAAGDADAPVFNKGDTVNQNVPTPKVRKNFPETWIWDETITGDTGVKTYSLTLPDTTTTWEISAFAVSHSTGLGVLDPDVQIIASRDFFISLTLPPTMVADEILSLRVTVYNFFSYNVEVQLILEESEWYEIVMNTGDEDIEGRVRAITITSEDGKTETFTIRFLKPGMAKIKVTALSETASDAVERLLSVTPQGIERDIVESSLIERDGDDPAESNTTFDVNIPSFAVEGSVYGQLTVSGSVMGSSWNNLGNLLQLPSGCGEQTMLSFAPDVFISLYLEKVGLLEGEIRRKSSRHIISGYQNELRYQHKDGSFSAFGNDDKGSTWLTSFVVKSFIAARELDEDFAHEQKIDPAINFLLGTQQSDGSFKEDGYVRHRAMQGGVSSRETMTAYVLIALTEGNYKIDHENISTAVGKAKQYLEANIGDITEPFPLSVMAYALALSDSSLASGVMNQMEQMAKVDGKMKYWVTGEEQCSSKSPSDYCGYSVATASDIEMTAYVLLALMKLGSASESMPIVRWVMRQRNARGGFRSTQDTVMAIQALSVFAGFYTSSSTNLTFQVTHSADANFSQIVSVTDENAIVLQSIELPPVSGMVTVTTLGVGLADLQLSYKYYLPLEDRANEPFDVLVNIREENGLDKINVEVCSSVNNNAEKPVNETGMFLIALTVPSGYTANDKEAASQNQQTKMIELVGNEITGYFDELSATGDVCVTFPINRFMKVGKVKPQSIRVFDYYKPDKMSLRMYAPEQSDDLCDTFGTDLPGCSGGGISSVVQSLTAMLIQIAIAIYISN